MQTGGLAGAFTDRSILYALLEALESARLGCVIVVGSGGDIEVVYANRVYAQMIGVDPREATARPPFAFVPPEDAERLEELRHSIRVRGTVPPRTISTRFLRDDGTSVPIDVAFGYALLNDRRATFCFIKDTVEKTSMEAALHESEDRFRSVAHASPDGIAIFVAGECVYSNPRAVEMYERDAEQLSLFESLRTTDPESNERTRRYVERVQRGDAVPPLSSRRISKTGEAKDLEASFSATKINGKDATLVFTRDITDRKRLHAEILKQDRLASLGVLAAGVAHELNNPLAALNLLVSRLKNATASDAPARALADDIEQVDEGVRRMTSIIGDLLFLARPADQPHAHVDLEKVLASSVSLLRAGVPNCPPIVEDVAQLPPVKGVPSKLGQAVLNVVRNALQACAEGGTADPKVVLSARADDGEIRITVADNGIGISEDVLPRLMTPFYTTKEGGTGLGLWITQGILQSHGGRLEVASKRGVGTTVTMVLPA
jgi:two-component system, NtrC family, sensor kinase